MVIKSFTSNTNDAKLDAFITASNEKLNSISNDVKRIEESVRKEISLNRIETSNESKRARGELSESLQSFKQDLSQTIQQFNTIQKDNFFELLRKQSDQNHAQHHRTKSNCHANKQ
jgi:DNA recombination protein RmuC